MRRQVLASPLSRRSLSSTLLSLSLSLCTGAVALAADMAKPSNPFEGQAEVLPEGKSLFNQYCAHCHGPNAVQGERPRDLRRLNKRYGADAISVFYTTINGGRMDKGMPPWRGVLAEDVIWRIYTFLQSVQAE
jgi:mono/diheme cytochrome c family protein